MNVKELEARVIALEKTVETLQAKVGSQNGIAVAAQQIEPAQQSHWWDEDAGKYKDDPDFQMAMRLGRKYRKAVDAAKTKKENRRQQKQKS